MRFDELLYNEDVLDGLYDMNFEECTPIQEQAIPPILEGRDLLACAQTGTGKTAAYLLPVIDLLADGGFPEDAVNCVIMAPTRELAQQIDRQLQGFAYFMPVSGMAIYGGTDGHTYDQQRRSLKMGTDIVIATPGRLLAHLSMGYVDLSKVSFFILDEADRMLDMGFYDDIMQIVGRLPKERQTLLFSATMPPKIQAMASKILNDPVVVKLAVSRPADKIRQSAYVCYETQKLPILKKIFNENPPNKVIIFSSSKLKVKNLARELKSTKWKIAEMHSDLDQTSRDNVILDFKAGKVNVIVATDILARGIDIDDIEMVINYDVPHEAEDYVHRVGRTARANREGSAVTFVSSDEIRKFRQIEKFLKKEVEKIPVDESLGETPSYDGPQPSGKKQNQPKGKAGNQRRYNSGAKPKKHNNSGAQPPTDRESHSETVAKTVPGDEINNKGNARPEKTAPKKRRHFRNKKKTDRPAETSNANDAPVRKEYHPLNSK